MAEQKPEQQRQQTSRTQANAGDVTIERQDTTVATVTNDSNAADLKANLTFTEDADLHPTGEPDSDTEKEPGGPPATEPNRPPFATNRPDVPIITALATGSGQHTPPDPATVDSSGYVRPLKAEEEQGK